MTVSQVGRDKYRGRIDAAVATRNIGDVSAAMLNGGFARSYDGGRRGGVVLKDQETSGIGHQALLAGLMSDPDPHVRLGRFLVPCLTPDYWTTTRVPTLTRS